jgi:hypothetical protein
MLGTFGWLNDQQLLNRTAEYPHACMAFTKQQRPYWLPTLDRLRGALARCHGFPADALPELQTLAPPDELGQPAGPHTPASPHDPR